MEKKIGGPIKCLKTDREGEFNFAEFNDFYKQHGAKRQLTIALYPTTKWNGRTQKLHCYGLGKSYADKEESA